MTAREFAQEITALVQRTTGDLTVSLMASSEDVSLVLRRVEKVVGIVDPGTVQFLIYGDTHHGA